MLTQEKWARRWHQCACGQGRVVAGEQFACGNCGRQFWLHPDGQYRDKAPKVERSKSEVKPGAQTEPKSQRPRTGAKGKQKAGRKKATKGKRQAATSRKKVDP